MPSWIFDKNNLTKEKFLNEENEDIRAGIVEVLGEEELLKLLNAECVNESKVEHKNGEAETLLLYKTKETIAEEEDLNGKSNVPLAWLRMTCPSTGSNYLIFTDSSFNTAIEAAKYHRPELIPSEIDYIWDSRN